MAKVDILAVAKEAQLNKQIDPSVIDATIGMFYDDNRNLVIDDVNKAFQKVNALDIFKYGPTDGHIDFKENVIDWVLDSHYDILNEKFMINSILTPGGSGAISIVFNTFGKLHDKVLISDIRWRYDYFTNTAFKKIESFNLFKDNLFDLEDFKLKLDNLVSIQEEVIIVINDPCHNPSGYQLSEYEWKSIIKIINSYKDNKIVLLYDIAYLDYHPKGYTDARKNLLHFMKLEKHVEVMIAFSASKTFGIYGLRLGAIIALQQIQSSVTNFLINASEDSLGKWSSPSSIGPAIFNEIVKDKKNYIKKLEELTSTLKIRGEIFIKEAEEHHLLTYPYKGGFFILVKSDNAHNDFLKLKENKIYSVPMDEGIRIALCSLTTKEVYGLARRIKDIIK